jgi:catechol 2,3-dioxygenase-like lactoylglutathione lyase family enzyme
MHSAVLPTLKLSFDAVFYYVRNMDRSIAFYREILGLNLVSHDFVARFDVDGVLFELVPTPHGQAVSGTGNARLCLQVRDIRETIRQLRERGVESSEVKAEPGGLLSFFHDPDRNQLCCGST